MSVIAMDHEYSETCMYSCADVVLGDRVTI